MAEVELAGGGIVVGPASGAFAVFEFEAGGLFGGGFTGLGFEGHAGGFDFYEAIGGFGVGGEAHGDFDFAGGVEGAFLHFEFGVFAFDKVKRGTVLVEDFEFYLFEVDADGVRFLFEVASANFDDGAAVIVFNPMPILGGDADVFGQGLGLCRGPFGLRFFLRAIGGGDGTDEDEDAGDEDPAGTAHAAFRITSRKRKAPLGRRGFSGFGVDGVGLLDGSDG